MMIEDHNVYLGVDGGGSKTIATFVNKSGHEVGQGVAGSSNITSVGLVQAIANIHEAVHLAQRMLPSDSTIDYAWLGLAGLDQPQTHTLLYPHLSHLAANVLLTNDAELHFAALPDASGVAVIAGTGSIAIARNPQGSTLRVGGWGHIFGDEGSGYDLGRRALQAAARASDGRGPATLLLPLILDQWQISTAPELISQVYSTPFDKANIAKLSPLLFQAAQQNDTLAISIMNDGAKELALAAATACQRHELASTTPIGLALGGGLFLNEHAYRDIFLHYLQELQDYLPPILIDKPSLQAARAAISLTAIHTL